MKVMTASVFLFTAAVCVPSTTACVEKEIPLSEVPELVMTGARGALERVEIVEAERIEDNGSIVYELEGTAAGIEYEIRVSPSGEVLGIEEDD